ncbi:protein OPI10 homolog [Copidosoma floridanum]|uniref:protein OPI10 homolog n=1 Tax=Copidosoma floridanum TaxID=29053 RepID=UPI0006C93FF8|nr:protein OPI10 homolog [Copidosoma floridanum]
MLGIIVSGRQVETNFLPIAENKFVVTIPDADNINHIVIFITEVTSFPEGLGGAVYFSWPDPIAPPNWQFLGHISKTKPSAIFKISNLKKNHEFVNNDLGGFGIGNISHNAQIGISIEPLTVILQQEQILMSEPKMALMDEPNVNVFMEFAQKTILNFLNYISSFSVTQAQMTPNPTENFVPLSSIQSWYETFQRRLQQNPNFWKA